jgi:hypothetical protein
MVTVCAVAYEPAAGLKVGVDTTVSAGQVVVQLLAWKFIADEGVGVSPCIAIPTGPAAEFTLVVTVPSETPLS